MRHLIPCPRLPPQHAAVVCVGGETRKVKRDARPLLQPSSKKECDREHMLYRPQHIAVVHGRLRAAAALSQFAIRRNYVLVQPQAESSWALC